MSAVLLALLLAQSGVQAPPLPDGPVVLYFVSADTPVHVAPHGRTKSTGRLRPFDVVTGRTSGAWLMIETASGGFEEGWIPFVPENVINAPLDTLKRRMFHVRQARWPDRVKLDVARGQIRAGFTGDQVQLALGDPITKELVRDGDNVTETWVYQDRRVAFSHTGVSTIEILESQR
jgi:hypothetical protein